MNKPSPRTPTSSAKPGSGQARAIRTPGRIPRLERISRGGQASYTDPDEDTTSEGTARHVRTYRNTVMATPDFRRSYEDTLEGSLDAEFPASLADALVSTDEFTQRVKRKIPLTTSDAIWSRERFHETLDEEQKSLEDASSVLERVRERTEELSDCSIRTASLERLPRFGRRTTTCSARANGCSIVPSERSERPDGPSDGRANPTRSTGTSTAISRPLSRAGGHRHRLGTDRESPIWNRRIQKGHTTVNEC